jgi:membrane associated rhomboid family serine protease
MLKNRTFGMLSVVAGIIVNNFAYLYDVMRDAHSGYIYLGSKGVIAAVVGVALVLLGAFVLMRSGVPED